VGQFLQILIAVGIGVVILAVGWWAINLLATPVPGEPDPDDVVEVSIDYRCSVCGLRLTITHAAGEEIMPPRHCREEMEPV
jgi:hypothetical protein